MIKISYDKLLMLIKLIYKIDAIESFGVISFDTKITHFHFRMRVFYNGYNQINISYFYDYQYLFEFIIKNDNKIILSQSNNLLDYQKIVLNNLSEKLILNKLKEELLENIW